MVRMHTGMTAGMSNFLSKMSIYDDIMTELERLQINENQYSKGFQKKQQTTML
jgi:hypothetical protein